MGEKSVDCGGGQLGINQEAARRGDRSEGRAISKPMPGTQMELSTTFNNDKYPIQFGYNNYMYGKYITFFACKMCCACVAPVST